MKALRYLLLAVVAVASVVFPPRGVPVYAAASIAEDTDGLVGTDDFNRSDSDTVGGDWVEEAGDCDIASNELEALGGANVSCRYEGGSARDEYFIQVEWTFSNSTVPPFIMIETTGGDGYLILADNFNTNFDLYESSVGLLQSTNQASGWNVGTLYDAQFYSADSVQEGWSDALVTTPTVSDSDATEDGVNKWPKVGRGGTSATATFDNFMAFLSKNITCTGLDTGDKCKVLNSGESVVCEATESSGTATIDCSIFGSATEVVPFSGGWPEIIVTDSSDTELASYSGSIYPGGSYSYTSGASFAWPQIIGGR